MIERISQDRLHIPNDAFATALSSIIENYAGGSFKELARELTIPWRYIESWLCGFTRPRIDTLMDLCYRLDIPVDRFLLDSTELTACANWRKLGRAPLTLRHNMSTAEVVALGTRLREILSDRLNTVPTPTKLAHEFKISYTSIQYHFPDEYAQLKNLADDFRNKSRSFTRQQRLKVLALAVTKLVEEGIYPGERQLRERSLMSPSDLRRLDVREELAKFQKEFREKRRS